MGISNHAKGLALAVQPGSSAAPLSHKLLQLNHVITLDQYAKLPTSFSSFSICNHTECKVKQYLKTSISKLSDMPPIRSARNRKPPPDGFDDLEDTLLEFSNKMKDAENASHEGKKRHEVLWPIFQITHQRAYGPPAWAPS